MIEMKRIPSYGSLANLTWAFGSVAIGTYWIELLDDSWLSQVCLITVILAFFLLTVSWSYEDSARRRNAE